MFAKKVVNTEDQVMQEVSDEQLSQVTGGSLLNGGALDLVTGTTNGVLGTATGLVGGVAGTATGLVGGVTTPVTGLVGGAHVRVGADVEL